MYRSRMGGKNPAHSVLNYLSSAEADSDIMTYDILGSQAHVLMLLKTGIISRQAAKKILDALRELGRKKRIPVADMDDSAEDIHEMIESYVIKRSGMESGGRMHTARSRNDQVALDTRMKIRDDINEMCGHLLDVAESMILLALEHKRTAMPLYTHMQHAQTGLFSHWLLAHADALLRDYERLSEAFVRVNKSPLGAGPVGGTSLPIDRDYVADLLGFDGIVENSLDATGTRDFAAEYAAVVSIMMSNMSRMAEDVVVWSTSEFSFVELADDLASPSSAMPQKKNPDVLEVTRAKTAEAAGNLSAILNMIKGLASGYGRDLQQIKPLLWSISRTGITTLLALRSILGGIRVNKHKMRRAVESSDLGALDMAEVLVAEHDIPFRVAHGVAATLVRHAGVARKSVRDMTLQDIKKAIKTDEYDDMARTSMAAARDPEILHAITSSFGTVPSLRSRNSKGSTGYTEQKRMITARKILVENLRNDLDARVKRIDGALVSLRLQARNI